jgi:hypothetical protein
MDEPTMPFNPGDKMDEPTMPFNPGDKIDEPLLSIDREDKMNQPPTLLIQKSHNSHLYPADSEDRWISHFYQHRGQYG